MSSDLVTGNRLPLVMLSQPAGQMVVLRAPRIVEGTGIVLTVISEGASDSVALESIKKARGQPVGVAYATTAHLAVVGDCERELGPDGERWTIRLTPVEKEPPLGMEMGFGDLSADKLAELRAKRLLLDEKLEPVPGEDQLNEQTRELFVRGWEAPMRILQSPFPPLYKELSDNPEAFKEIARLIAVLMLRLSWTVETIVELKLSLEGDKLHVLFRGKRRKVYVNREPTPIAIEGTCLLQ